MKPSPRQTLCRRMNTIPLGRKHMTFGVCALCIEPKVLRKSHIIPNAVFRRIKHAQNSAQLLQFDDSEHTPVQHSQESWREYLLCADCEQVIAENEKYGLDLLRGSDGSKTYRHSEGVTFRAHDYRRFKLFLTSLLWRAAVSKQAYFSKVILPDDCKEEARASLRSGRPLGHLRLGCKLLQLTDDTSAADGGFSPEMLEQIVMSPIPRLHEGRPYYTFLFVFEGFLLEYFVRGVPHKLAHDLGMHRPSPVLFVPHRTIFDVPELVKLMVSAYRKDDRGVVKFRSQQPVGRLNYHDELI